MKYVKTFIEETSAVGGPTVSTGMGGVVSAQPSTLPGTTTGPNFFNSGGTIGSGDIGVPFNATGGNYMKLDVDRPYKSDKKKKKKTKEKSKNAIELLSKELTNDENRIDFTQNAQGKVMDFTTFFKSELNKPTKVLEHRMYSDKIVIGDVYPEEDVYIFTQKIHHTPEDFFDGDLGDRIEQYEEYIVKEVNISDIQNLDEFQLDEDLVEEYTEILKKNDTYPPIVLDEEYNIIDGTHRANALNDLGKKKIIAFVGKQ